MAGQPQQPPSASPVGNPMGGSGFIPFGVSDFEGRASGSSISVPDGKLVRLPNQPCKLVLLFNWNASDNPTFDQLAASANGEFLTTGDEIYYGFNGIIVGQVFPSSNSGLLPISNLNQMVLRTRPGKSKTVWYAWWV